ncbi:hypothetical protein HDE_11569 [Halotydeus destructor]|nr:hypothetical protein HDE_11569 [Halotydeus destructor]
MLFRPSLFAVVLLLISFTLCNGFPLESTEEGHKEGVAIIPSKIRSLLDLHIGTLDLSLNVVHYHQYPSQVPGQVAPATPLVVTTTPAPTWPMSEKSQVTVFYQGEVSMGDQVHAVAANLLKQAVDNNLGNWERYTSDGLKARFGVPFECIMKANMIQVHELCGRQCAIFKLRTHGSLFFVLIKRLTN